ncbi:hypothetical protein JOF53_004850 [Crossiella equi]|uniref:DUF4349 domain-containing protein n=1 Tax=Crossiella equi TaxID=130796 RepID=A0ABS5AHC2_9PSEU|nr:DUF4349 domain-containing protein [Crossiella equi]MBP2475978.1 hypothetical protein [Crossiella equi]
MAKRSLLALGALGLVLLAGCSGNGRETAAVAPAGPNAASDRNTQSYGGGGAAEKQAAPPEQPKTEAQPTDARQLIRTARVELRVEDVAEALRKAQEQARAAGGFASDENTREQRASLTLRVPADKLDAVLDGLGGLGKVEVREQRSQDVTDQLVDTKSRLDSARASVDRVRALLDRAGTVGEVVQVEGELTKRQAELESLQRRLESMSRQVAMATVTVQLVRTDQAVAPSGGSLKSAFDAGWRAFLAVLNGILMALAAALPFLVLFGAVGALVVVLVRRRKTARPGPVAPAEGTEA